MPIFSARPVPSRHGRCTVTKEEEMLRDYQISAHPASDCCIATATAAVGGEADEEHDGSRAVRSFASTRCSRGLGRRDHQGREDPHRGRERDRLSCQRSPLWSPSG